MLKKANTSSSIRAANHKLIDKGYEVLNTGRLWFFSQNQRQVLRAEFERVALPHLSHLYTAALYLTRDRDEAEDLVQET